MPRKKKKDVEQPQPSIVSDTDMDTDVVIDKKAIEIPLKNALAGAILSEEMRRGIPQDIYRAFQSWEAYGSLDPLTIIRVKAVLTHNSSGVSFEKRLERVIQFVEYILVQK